MQTHPWRGEMTSYQVAQLVQASLYLGLVTVTMAYIVIARPRTLSPVVALGVLTGVLGAGFFLAAFFAADSDLPPVLQLLVKLLRDLPVVLIVLYACRMQLNGYSFFAEPLPAARRWMTGWFARATPVVLSSFALGGLAELVLRPAFLESDAPLPPSILVSDGLILVPLAFYAALSCFVFGWTLLRESADLRLRDRLENLCGTVALGGLSFLALHTLAWRAVRALLPVDLVEPILEQMSVNQIFIVGAVALSISVGLISHSTRDASTREASRRLVSLASDLAYFSDRLANNPVRDPRLRLCRDAMLKAAGPDFLGLEPAAERRAHRVFRGVLFIHEEPDRQEGSRETRERLRSIVRLCDEERRSSTLTKALGGHRRHSLPDALQSVLANDGAASPDPATGGLETQGLRREAQVILHPVSAAEASVGELDCGTRLALVALWDAGILPQDSEEIDGALLVQGEVADAYNLAKYQLRICGDR
jgi:hypothetical protein